MIDDKLLTKILKKEVMKIIAEKNTYNLTNYDELFEFMWLKPKITGLNVDIFVDDGKSYLRNSHPLLLFIRNGYEKQTNSFIPMTVEERPRVLDDEMEFNITYNDIFDVQDFIQRNLMVLKSLANQGISQEVFVKNINLSPAYSYSISESRKLLTEMATLRMSESHLPMDIWLDEGGLYHGHAPRLKFKASNEQRTTMEYSSMLLTETPTIENFPDNSPIRKKDLDKLSEFVVNNLELLLKLANGEIDYLTEFKPNYIKPNT